MQTAISRHSPARIVHLHHIDLTVVLRQTCDIVILYRALDPVLCKPCEIIGIIVPGAKLYPLGSCHHIGLTFQCLDSQGSCHIHLHSLLLVRHPRGDEDDSVGTSRAVDGCRRGILEGLDRCNVCRIESCDIIHRNTVHDIKRLRFRIDGSYTSYADGDIGTGRSTVGADFHTGKHTLKG